MSPARRGPVVAAVLLAVALTEVVVAVAAGAASGRGFGFLLDHFVVTNAIIGASLAVAGAPIGWHRPGNPIGWLLLAGGVLYAGSAAAFSLLAWGSVPGEQRPFWRAVGTWANGSWPAAIVCCIPVALLLFPDGRLPGPRWRWLLVVAAVETPLFVATAVFPPGGLAAELRVPAYLVWPGFARFGWVEPVTAVLGQLLFGAVLVSLVLRFKRGDDRVRRQLLWPFLAVVVVTLGFTVPTWLGIQTYASLFAIALIPLSISVAVLRHQLLDIKLVASRFASYLLLSAVVVGVYVGLVAVLGGALDTRARTGGSALVVVLVAVAFNPLRSWAQRVVDRLFYGSRQDPVRALAAVGARLSGPADEPGLEAALVSLCRTLRLPWATLRAPQLEVITGSPEPGGPVHVVELRHGPDHVGELAVGLRPGERRPAAADLRVLDLLGSLLAVALHAVALSRELAASQQRLLSARDEERRRLRRDLHDGLGPRLTGVILKAGAARRFAGTDGIRAGELLGEVERDAAAAVDDVRRILDALRPVALDGLGLVGALREYVATAGRPEETGLRIDVRAPDHVGPLPAHVELGAYRIATEALTNVVRHSGASRATLTLQVEGGELRMRIEDDGPRSQPWSAGVGLTSMGERAAELGGRFEAGPDGAGGHVAVALPVAVP